MKAGSVNEGIIPRRSSMTFALCLRSKGLENRAVINSDLDGQF